MILNNIQILRFFAAAAVVQYHAIDVISSYGFEQKFFAFFKGWGIIGVDLFFVISGFVLYKVCLDKDISARRFLLDRIIRIVPLYWIATLTMAGILLVFPQYLRSEQFDLLRLLSSLFFVSGLLDFSFPTLGVGWTLEYEFLFYLFLVLILTLKVKRNAIFIFIILFGGLHYIGYTSTLVFEFLMGMIIAWYFKFYGPIRAARYIFLLSIVLVTFSIPLTGSGIDRAILYGVPSFCLVLSAISIAQSKINILTLLGNASFSIYLTHQPLLSVLGKVGQAYTPDLNGDMLSCFCVFFLILIGLFVYWFFERPLIAFFREHFAVRKPA